jgi:hypothetical protein
MASFGLGRTSQLNTGDGAGAGGDDGDHDHDAPMGTALATSASTSAASNPTTTMMMVDDSTPWMAATEGNIKLLQRSLQQLKLPLTVADGNGYTLLHAAASYNQIGVLNYIWIQLSPDIDNDDDNDDGGDGTGKSRNYINQQDFIDGDTALHYCECIDAARFLVETCHADTTVRNSQHLTPLEKHRQTLKESTDGGDDGDDDDDDSDNEEEREALNILIEYLSSLEQ